MRIVIDMQGAQSSESRTRGIGRYTLALCKEMARLRGKHEVVLALNGLFADSVESIRAEFNPWLSQNCICVWDVPEGIRAVNQDASALREAAERIRESFLGDLSPDILLVTSLFEGLMDDAAVSVRAFSNRFPIAVVLYDLIPFIHRETYLANELVERWYMERLDHLRRADLLLSISASSGREAVKYLDFCEDRVVNISTACDSHFQPHPVSETDRSYLKKTYGINRPFVMYTGGLDHRKNIEGLIRAYAALPKTVRKEHQLAIVCSAPLEEQNRLKKLAADEGLNGNTFVMTGFVPEDDLVLLYNACRLFVFPSWHEGFGLPALEAMACGRAVIGSNCTSVPEVIGLKEAMFDPFDEQAITDKMEMALVDDGFRERLEKNARERSLKFSWEKTAAQALEALEKRVGTRDDDTVDQEPSRPRLAYVSPVPPVPSGIADYSAELLPWLHRYYDIEVIVDQESVSDPWIEQNCPVRDVRWFRDNAERFDRVLYHFGNSPFHAHMFDLLDEIPGVVVLHEFFLSHIVSHLEYDGTAPHRFRRTLASAHGWPAVRMSFESVEEAAWKYPCNMEVLQQSMGVIVHADYPRRLAREWFGGHVADNWTVIPLLRHPVDVVDQRAARRRLGVKKNAFVVCCFGMIGTNKLSRKLLDAWMESPLAGDSSCRLIFVGQNSENAYGQALAKTLRKTRISGQVEITGRVELSTYRDWLSAADVGVQLRGLSRGETSAAVLDCMNYGLATIVNANGSMKDLAADSVCSIPDDFSKQDLINALCALREDEELRKRISRRARQIAEELHHPEPCAAMYNEAMERCYCQTPVRAQDLLSGIATGGRSLSDSDLRRVASAVAVNFPPEPRCRQLFLDVSILVQHDAKSGIQRVVRSLLDELLRCPPDGWRIEPVYADGSSAGYRYARRFACRFLGIPDTWTEDQPIDAWPGDVFVGLDLQHQVIPLQEAYLSGLYRRGVGVYFVVYDLLPVLFPAQFPDGAKEMHEAWLRSISRFSGAVCISKAVCDELTEWMLRSDIQRKLPYRAGWFHLGADIENSRPTTGLPDDTESLLEQLSTRPSFITVGTIEPRKGQAQILDAFERLWSRGVEANLVVVGRQGWKMKPLVERMGAHREAGSRLFWLDGISDEYLEKIYAASTCLIAASTGEGFGLPLIEAAQHKKPIIVRDIPVFREVAGEYAFYFDGQKPEDLASAVETWLEMVQAGTHPKSDEMPWLTWKQSAEQLLDVVLNRKPVSLKVVS